MWSRDQANAYYEAYPDALTEWKRSGMGYSAFAQQNSQQTGRMPTRMPSAQPQQQYSKTYADFANPANQISWADNVQKWDLNSGPRPDDPYSVYYSNGASDQEVYNKAVAQAQQAYLGKAKELLGQEKFMSAWSNGQLDQIMQEQYGINKYPNRSMGNTDWRTNTNTMAAWLQNLKNWQPGGGTTSESNVGTPPAVPVTPTAPVTGTGMLNPPVSMPGTGAGTSGGLGSFGGASGSTGGGMLGNTQPVRPAVPPGGYPRVGDSSSWLAQPSSFTAAQQGMLR